MGDAAMRDNIPGSIQPEGCYEIDIRETLRNSTQQHGLFSQLLSREGLANDGPQNDVCERIHLLKMKIEKIHYDVIIF